MNDKVLAFYLPKNHASKGYLATVLKFTVLKLQLQEYTTVSFIMIKDKEKDSTKASIERCTLETGRMATGMVTECGQIPKDKATMGSGFEENVVVKESIKLMVFIYLFREVVSWRFFRF